MKTRWRSAAVLLASAGWLFGSGCAPDDPFDFGGPRSCEIPDQNEWVYGLMQEAYLFADDLPVLDPQAYESPAAMVADLRVDPDRWSRVSDKARSDALFQEGMVVSLGIRTRRDVDQSIVVADVSPDSPADEAGIQRGDVISTIAGLTTEQIDEEERWSEVYGAAEPGVRVDMNVIDAQGTVRPVSLVKDWIAIDTVPTHGIHSVDGRSVGYLQFATFVDTAPAALDEVFAGWNQAGVREVVIDLRYNGGGLVSVARHFMHLLVGAVAEGSTAYRIRYNDTFSDENMDRELLRLDHSLRAVDHVVFITTRSSLSASELLINAIVPHAKTSIVGSTTGGKPVGSKHFDFCDSVAVPLTFRLVNADDQGDYFDGLAPDCAAPDDLYNPLGSPEEASLATALHLLQTGRCLEHPDPEAATVEPSAPFRSPSEDASSPDPWPVLAELH